VREHRVADDVADRMDVRDIRALLACRRNEAAVGDCHARLVRVDFLPFALRPTATSTTS